MSNKFIDFYRQYEKVILLALAFVLVVMVSYRAGQTNQQSGASSEINISLIDPESVNPREEKILAIEKALKNQGFALDWEVGAKENAIVAGQSTSQDPKSSAECAFVGSKNSDKYHLPDSSWADRIKPENRVCFKSKEDAEASGYVPSASLK